MAAPVAPDQAVESFDGLASFLASDPDGPDGAQDDLAAEEIAVVDDEPDQEPAESADDADPDAIEIVDEESEQEAVADAPTEPAVAEESARKLAREWQRKDIDLTIQALRGDTAAAEKLGGPQRKLLRETRAQIEAEVERRVGDVNGDVPIPGHTLADSREVWDWNDRILARDPEAMYRLDTDHEFSRWWAGLQEEKKEVLKIPANASSEEMRRREREIARYSRMEATVRNEVAANVDPDTTYDEFIGDPAWALLTREEQQALDPENFATLSPAAAVRRMEREFGQAKARAEIREQTKSARRDARQNGQPRQQRTAPQRPALSSGGTAPRQMTFNQIRDQFTANPTEANRRLYERARESRGWK